MSALDASPASPLAGVPLPQAPRPADPCIEPCSPLCGAPLASVLRAGPMAQAAVPIVRNPRSVP
ncbi:proline-rich receptor-like protein kinase PERK2 [Iris pallida]|uniref:Proline-rich receptor-like protein kinase PERK2 n=1 Tax=Iris pallida TaxID=29817 RepID=A0AAX6FVP6_IRIPA|nr:proline-rich receptor-like protein kinase PERK2 [Iris pallida]